MGARSLIPVLVVVAFVVCLFVWVFRRQAEFEEQCLAKGGTPYFPYKSPPICLAKGTVIP